jgi:ABC-type multidrug transport system permease subunit
MTMMMMVMIIIMIPLSQPTTVSMKPSSHPQNRLLSIILHNNALAHAVQKIASHRSSGKFVQTATIPLLIAATLLVRNAVKSTEDFAGSA